MEILIGGFLAYTWWIFGIIAAMNALKKGESNLNAIADGLGIGALIGIIGVVLIFHGAS
jgi:hypothetical protein